MAANILELFKPAPAIPLHQDQTVVNKKYRYWRLRLMYSSYIGYVVYYFLRQNISIALPLMEKSLGLTKANLGLFLSLHKVLYGVSKFVSGVLADRSNPRYFMAIGLLFSALMNFAFGFSSSIFAFGIFWMFNGWFQAMGFPPCARLLSQWFSPKERGLTWGIWNSSHQVGAVLILVFAGVLGKMNIDFTVPLAQKHLHLDGWQLCFLAPALLSVGVALFLINRLRDTPASLGLPPVEVYKNEHLDEKHAAAKEDLILKSREFFQFLIRHVFNNKYVWYVSFANFFVYILRYAFLDWAPTCLMDMKGMTLQHGGWMTCGFEISGAVGSLLGGVITDRYLKSRRAPVCVFYMLASAALVYVFWHEPSGQANAFNITLDLFFLGFFIYGPQFLVGVMTADLATKHAAATAIGLTGFFGYLSGVVSGWGLGWLVDHHGWDAAFIMLFICALLGAFFFALSWNAKPMAPPVTEAEI